MKAMTTLQRVRCVWQNWPGAPGYTNFYEDASVVSHEPYRVFFDAVKGLLPNAVTIQVPGNGDIIEDTTGAIVGAYAIATPAVVSGGSASVYSGGSGAVIDWLVSGLVAGRRPIGRTFLVPCTSTAMDASGSLIGTANTTITNAATALIASMAGAMKVWSRPFAGGPGGVPAARLGSQHAIVSARVPDLAAQLRSRRT